MSCVHPQAPEYWCRFRSVGKTNSAHRVLFPLILLLLIFSSACGGKKTQVKRPVARPLPQPTAKKQEPAKAPTSAKPIPKTPLPPVAEKPPEMVIAAPVEPAPAISQAMEPATGPFIRIGLTTTAKEIRISSAGDYYVSDKKPEAERQLIQGEIQIRAEQEIRETGSGYRIQVASLSNPETAEDLKNKLEKLLQLPVVVRENPSTGTNQVRVGEFSDKEDAQSTLRKLNESGYGDAFLVKDEVMSEGGKPALSLRGPKNLFRAGQAGFLIQPSTAVAFLSIDGKPYRGILDIILNKNGRITVVNQLGTEEYLLGVVPAEISPTTYPEFAALAAQAIAARTYALRNMGRYRAEGFDLTNDPRTQVYGGVAMEKEATDLAVRQTSGLAIYHNNKLIDAMYMSTCGGRTEDSSNVFDGPEVPYLKSVFCAIESGPEKGATVLEGKHALDQSILSDDGSIANRNIALALAAGLIENETGITQEYIAGSAKRDEIVRWVEKAVKLARKDPSDHASAPSDVETRSGFFRYAAESFFGSGEIRRKLSTRDLEYYIGNLKDGDAVPAAARYALAYLMQAGVWRPSAENTVRPDAPIRRSDALFLLLQWIEAARPDMLQKGAFVTAKESDSGDSDKRSIRIKKGNRTKEYILADTLPLFRMDMGRTTPVTSLKIIGNEKVSFHVDASGSIDFLEIELSPAGASSDRYSPVASWDATLTRSAVAEKVRNLADNIGQFQDLKPERIGQSGRVTQMRIVGSRRSTVVNGNRLRGALGLRDTLFTITRELNSDGSVAGFTFHGRGWGHGVGLCQVGAFGMARAGHSYEEILKTYYQGVEIKKAY